MIIGVKMNIPDAYGSYIGELLRPVQCSEYNWELGHTEVYPVKEKSIIIEELFPEKIMAGKDFQERINSSAYYVISFEGKAFPKDTEPSRVSSYEEFTSSNCMLLLLISSSSDVKVYCRDEALSRAIFENAKEKGFENITLLENDSADNEPSDK